MPARSLSSGVSYRAFDFMLAALFIIAAAEVGELKGSDRVVCIDARHGSALATHFFKFLCPALLLQPCLGQLQIFELFQQMPFLVTLVGALFSCLTM